MDICDFILSFKEIFSASHGTGIVLYTGNTVVGNT